MIRDERTRGDHGLDLGLRCPADFRDFVFLQVQVFRVNVHENGVKVVETVRKVDRKDRPPLAKIERETQLFQRLALRRRPTG